MLDNLAAFFHKYDPKRFSLIYALKAVATLVLSLFIAIKGFHLGNEGLIFLSLACMFIFFMNDFATKGLARLGLLVIFIIICSVFLLAIKQLALMGVYVVLPIFAWVFIMSLAPAISQDLSKICIYATLYGFALLLVASEYGINSIDVLKGFLIGSLVSICVRIISFQRYGAFTKRHMSLILDDLIYTCEFMPSVDFIYWRLTAISHINEMKDVFLMKSSLIKNTASIKNQEKALFFLYKCEEIAYLLVSLRIELRKNIKRDKELLRNLQAELIYNLTQIKLIFKGIHPKLKSSACKAMLADNNYKNTHALLEVLYKKFALIVQGGLKQIILRPKKSITFKQVCLKLRFKGDILRYAFKLSLAVSLALLIASFFRLDHGIWIAAFIFSIMKMNTSSVKTAGVQNLIGLFVGLGIGLLMVLLFKGTAMFNFILLFAYFCAIYFRFFRPTLAYIAITACLCIYYSVISSNYLGLVIIRSQDILISFVISMLISYLIWPSKSQNTLYKTFLTLLQDCSELLGVSDNEEISIKKYQLIKDLESFTNLLEELKGSRVFKKFLNMQVVIENLHMGISNLQNLETKAKDAHLNTDINMLQTRFTMLQAKANKKPYYFYPPKQISKSLACKDDKLWHSLYFIALEQHRAYKIIVKMQTY